MRSVTTFLILLPCWQCIQAAKILALLAMPWRSHHNVFSPVIRGLALKGHQVDYYTPLLIQDPPKRLKQFEMRNWQKEALEHFDQATFEKAITFKAFNMIGDLAMWILDKSFTNDRVSMDLLQSNETYDLVITEFPDFCESLAYIAHKFKAPSVTIVTFADSPWINEMCGLPDNPAYMASYGGYTDEMDFGQRLYNVYHTSSVMLAWAWATLTKQQALADRILRYEGWETRPKIMEMMSETALVLMNSHISSGFPYPKAPHVKEICGTHVDPKPLPKDLQDFMDDAPNGVIFFSLGSILNPAEILADGKFNLFLKVFEGLKQKVLWKVAPGLPTVDNPTIKVQEWFPQQGILHHKNMALFITHGGLQSTVEAISAGVPCLGIPFIFDQEKNVVFMQKVGMARHLSFDNITEDNLRRSVTEILADDRYREKAQKQKALFHDRPRKPVDEAVYWIEYVLKHGNILRPASAKMPFYQLYLLDVVAFITLCLLTVALALKFTIRLLVSITPSSGTSQIPHENPKKYS